ncbi:MAG: protein-disulfide reductase DsbD [Epsilonproteobacteria bacterium]|nr:protein-disulfide reductase DsbD [Campylobacterota bacterium]
MRKVLVIFGLLLAFLYGGFGDFASKSKFLTPQEAFKVEATTSQKGVEVNIKLGDKIHIYKDELKFKLLEPQKKEITIPLPPAKVYGDKEGYEGELNLTIPYSKIGDFEKFKFEVDLTGCSDDGICYSPQKYTFDLEKRGEAKKEEKKEGFGGFNLKSSSKFLSPAEAFKVNATPKEEGVEVKIELGKNIHIYKENLKFKVIKPFKKEIKIELPKGKIYGDKEGYEGSLSFFIPYSKIGANKFTLQVELLGCSDDGICYAPQKYSFDIEAKKSVTKSKTATASIDGTNNSTSKEEMGFFEKISKLAQSGNSKEIVEALKSEGIVFILLLFFIVGLLLALTPCILPMIPILSSILIQQAGKSKEGLSRKDSFILSLIYVVSMALAYAIIGVVAGLLNFDLQAHANNPFVIIPIALIFVALALSLFGYFELALPASLQSKLNNISNKAQGKGYFGTAVMGAISALVVGACTAPVISGAIIFISLTGDALLGGLALFVMGIGAGVPLLLVGLGANKLVPKPGGWMENVSRVFGVLMLLMALYIARGVISDSLFMFLFSTTLIGTALYFGVFDNAKVSGFKLILKILNFLVFLYGVIIFIGMVGGAKSILNPLKPFTSKAVAIASPIQETNHAPKRYTLQQLLDEIKNAKKPVVVDIGKENCAACTELNEITFPDPRVKEELKRFKFIKLDITDYTKDDQEIMKHFKIFGAPNILIFNSKGEPLEDKFIQGFIKPQKFTNILKEVE